MTADEEVWVYQAAPATRSATIEGAPAVDPQQTTLPAEWRRLPGYLMRIMKYHGIKRRAIHVDLIEAAPRLLPRLPKKTSRQVQRRLRRLGVKLYINSAVQGETADELTVSGKPSAS